MHRTNFIYKNRAEHLSKSGLLAYLLTRTSKNPLPQFKAAIEMASGQGPASPPDSLSSPFNSLADYLKGREGNQAISQWWDSACHVARPTKGFLYSNEYPFTAGHSQATQFLDLNTCSHHPTRMFWRKISCTVKKALELLDVPSRNTFLM
jgi:hypothetical protein